VIVSLPFNLSYRLPPLLLQYTVGFCLTDLGFFADRTNGRAYAAVLRPSVCLSSVVSITYVLWLKGAS